MKKQVLLVAGATLAIASASAFAQNVKSHPNMYVGLEGGVASSSVLQPNEGYNVTANKKDTSFVRAALGYQFTPNWALELGYFSTGDLKQSGTNGMNSYDAKGSVSGLDLAAIYKFTAGLPGLYLKAGVTQAKAAISANETYGDSSSSKTSSGYLFGLGYEYDFSQHWSANVSYSRYQRLADIDGANANVFGAGLKYRF